MARNVLENFMLVMVESLILILLKVQANDLAHIYFHPSSPPTLVPHFSKLDKVQTIDFVPASFCPSPLPILYPYSSKLDKVQGIMHTFFEDEINICNKRYLHRRFSKIYRFIFKTCVTYGFARCLEKIAQIQITVQHFDCLRNCLKHRNDLATCFTECYEKPINKQLDVVYTQNLEWKTW